MQLQMYRPCFTDNLHCKNKLMLLNAKRPSSVHHKAKRANSYLTPVHMVFSIQTHITEKAQSKHVLG